MDLIKDLFMKCQQLSIAISDEFGHNKDAQIYLYEAKQIIIKVRRKDRQKKEMFQIKKY